tara:strand:- start:6505 stop:6720 length:216 start_codon:yes stop_codon:yes gene_type:complete
MAEDYVIYIFAAVCFVILFPALYYFTRDKNILVRARDNKGRYVADDPKTIENEAFTVVKKTKKSKKRKKKK